MSFLLISANRVSGLSLIHQNKLKKNIKKKREMLEGGGCVSNKQLKACKVMNAAYMLFVFFGL